MDSFRQLVFSGYLDVDVFLQSIAAVVQWNPMLRSVVKKIGKNYFWEETDVPYSIQRQPPIQRQQGTDCPVPQRINLHNEPGFRVYTAESETAEAEEQIRVLLQFHHSVSDGVGEMEFIGDVLTDYSVRITGQTPPDNPRRLDPALLTIRGKSGLTLKSYVKNIVHTNFTTNQLVFGNPSPLAPCTKPWQTLEHYYVFCHHELTQEETAQYFASAKSNGVSVNDLLLRDLFAAIGSWRQRWVDGQTNPVFRVAVPMNLRTEKYRNIPASNNVTMLFLDRRWTQCQGNSEELLRGIHHEMEWIKRTEQKHYLSLSLRVRDLLWGGIAASLRSPKCRSTIAFSNLGRVLESLSLPRREDGRLKVGESVLESVDATPPIRPGTLISFSILTYAGRLRFILRYDALNMTSEHANDFLQRFVKAIQSSRQSNQSCHRERAQTLPEPAA